MSSPASALKLENVLYEKKGPIAYVTINRPKVLNALNAKTISELRSAFEDARDDSGVRGVVFTGAGDKAFAAGADISEIDRKSTRLNSSHEWISYAVFCLKKKKKK